MKLVVFASIVVLKAPTSYSLVTYLLQKEVDQVSIKKYVLLYSVSAPVMALLTYGILELIDKNVASDTQFRVGFLLVFSGGAFLYVSAMHVMQSVFLESDEFLMGHIKTCLFSLGIVTPLLTLFFH